MNNWRTTYTHLDTSLTHWLHSLPGEYSKISQLCHSDPGSKISNWIMLHAAFVLAVIRLHSVAAYPASTSTHFQPSYNAMQRCLGAVESLREIAQDTINNSMLDLLGPPFAFSLWTSARLLLVHAATVDQDVDPKIRFFISTLEAMGQYWQVALTYARTLDRLVREGSAAAAAASNSSDDPTSAGGVTNTPSTSTISSSGHNFPGNVSIIHTTNANNTNPTESPYQPRTFRAMRKRSYEMGRLLHGRREGGWWEASQVTVPHDGEVEGLDVFTFFDYPKVTTTATDEGLGVLDSASNGMSSVSGERGSREGTRTPVTSAAGGMSGVSGGILGPTSGGGGSNHMNLGGNTGGGIMTGSMGGVASQVQSPVFAMPVREGDWLGFQPPHE